MGFVIDRMVLTKDHDPHTAALVYGPISLIGFFFLFFYSLYYSPFPLTSLEFFAFSTLGGLFFLHLERKDKKIPVPFAVINSLVGAAGYVFLAYFYYQNFLH